MRNYEEQRFQTTIEGVKFMQKMEFDKFTILKSIDRVIENLSHDASNDFFNCLLDIRQKIVLGKEV